MRSHLLKSLHRFTAYNIYPMELKRGRMIVDISPHSLAEPGILFPSRGAVGARLLRFLIRFAAYSIHPIELELDRMILDISPLDRFASDISISPGGVEEGAPLEIFKSIYSLQFLSD